VDSKGKTWFWCPKHNDDKGLYVTHKVEDHQKWLEAKKLTVQNLKNKKNSD